MALRLNGATRTHTLTHMRADDKYPFCSVRIIFQMHCCPVVQVMPIPNSHWINTVVYLFHMRSTYRLCCRSIPDFNWIIIHGQPLVLHCCTIAWCLWSQWPWAWMPTKRPTTIQTINTAQAPNIRPYQTSNFNKLNSLQWQLCKYFMISTIYRLMLPWSAAGWN